MIVIGTSGYDYQDWQGYFYPDHLPRKSWLAYYAERFAALELNFSYYRIPQPGQLTSMVERTQGKVEFAIKAHRSLTHERTASDREIAEFLTAVEELRSADRLGAVLAQFPHSFRQCEENRSYLKRLAENIGPPLVVEMRRTEWATEPIQNWLEKIGVGYCCVDEPDIPGLMPREERVAARPAYVRFHGRNREKWYEHNQPEERYDYRYRADELGEWVGRIKRLEQKAGKVLVFFNNHFQAQAVDGARMMERLLSIQ